MWMYNVLLNIVITDINECGDASHTCGHNECVNTIGSFTCICDNGYELDNTLRVCKGNMHTCTVMLMNNEVTEYVYIITIQPAYSLK